jgi:DnaJ-class molecular chaperone
MPTKPAPAPPAHTHRCHDGDPVEPLLVRAHLSEDGTCDQCGGDTVVETQTGRYGDGPSVLVRCRWCHGTGKRERAAIDARKSVQR